VFAAAGCGHFTEYLVGACYVMPSVGLTLSDKPTVQANCLHSASCGTRIC